MISLLPESTSSDSPSSDGASSSKQSKQDEKVGESLKDRLAKNGLAMGKDKLPAKSVNGKTKSDKKTKTIQEDPKSSKAFKSLFTTSEKAQQQGKAHWVTYNPFYN